MIRDFFMCDIKKVNLKFNVVVGGKIPVPTTKLNIFVN